MKIALFLLLSCSLWAKTICLNMIVKDESAVIETCLNSVKQIIDYWVIVDTGSSDGTQEIIRNALKGVPGELHERPWVNFAHNRNEALAFAKEKGDYLLFIDADERLVFSPGFDKGKLDQDGYFCFVRVLDDTEGEYWEGQRVLLANNSLDWSWKGALHETPGASQAKTVPLLKSVINFADSKKGHRSQDPTNSLKDAKILEKMLEEDPNNTRTVYYLAQTYESAREYELALRNYEKTIAMYAQEQEMFWSLLRIARIQEILKKDPETIIGSYCRAFKHRASRLEPLYYMALQYTGIGRSVLSYALLKSGLSFDPCEDKVVHETWIYDYGLLAAFAKSAFAVGRYEESCGACERLLAQSELKEEVRAEANQRLLEARGALKDVETRRVEENFQALYQKAKGKTTSVGAIEAYSAAFQACPTHAEPLYYLAELYAKKQEEILAYAIAKAGASFSLPAQVQEKERWIYDYGLLNQWANNAYALQKFSEAVDAFEQLLSRENLPRDVERSAKQKLASAKRTIRDLEKFGLASF